MNEDPLAIEAYDEDAPQPQLDPKHAAFVEAYLTRANGNASLAAELAGYSQNHAIERGARLLQREDVRDTIRARLRGGGMTEEEALARLADQARGLGVEYWQVDDRTGELSLDLQKMRMHHKMHFIESVEETPRGQKIKLVSSQGALFKIIDLYNAKPKADTPDAAYLRVLDHLIERDILARSLPGTQAALPPAIEGQWHPVVPTAAATDPDPEVQ